MRWLIAALLAGLSVVASAQQVLVDGSLVSFDVPSVPTGQASVLGDLFIDVGPDASALRVDLGDLSGRNVDLLLSREPFPTNATSLNDFFNAADYFSAGTSGDEFVTILNSATPPVAGERWNIAIIAFEGAASQATLGTDIQFGAPMAAGISVDFNNILGATDCDIAPWNDNTPFAAIDGNNASTLGQARRNAMNEAARLIGLQLFSPVPIVIRGCWENLGAEGGGAVLASASTNLAFISTPGTSAANTIYVQAVSSRLAGTAICNIDPSSDCSEQDVLIRFNTDVDSDIALGNLRYYYGFSGPSGSDIDFISTAIHEIIHGLGFSSFIGQDGVQQTSNNGTPLADAFSNNLVDTSSGSLVPLLDPSLSDADRAAAFVSEGGLQWSGPESSTSEQNSQARVGFGLVRMHDPNPFESGSSVSHVNEQYCALMRAVNSNCNPSEFRGVGLEKAMLHEVGWAPAGNQPPYVGLYYDRAHDGHGFDFQLGGVDPVLGPIYVMTFYSYETLTRQPEWFQAAGPVQNGVFYGLRSDLTAGFGFPSFTYDTTRDPPQQADPTRFGQVSFSFNDPPGSLACNDGVNRAGAVIASFQFSLDNLTRDWCVEPLPATETHPALDFGGLWFAGEVDPGWGFSLENILRDDGSIDLFVLLYVYADDGTPVWYFGFESAVDLSGPIEFQMFQRTGFGRAQDLPPPATDDAAGNFTLVLGANPSAGLDGSNTATVDVSYLGPEGGDWIRNNVAVTRLSQPRD